MTGIPQQHMFWRKVGLTGGVAQVGADLPHLLDMVWQGTISQGKVFDLTLPAGRGAEAYAAMDERLAIKAC